MDDIDSQIQEAKKLADMYYDLWLNGTNDYLIPLYRKWQSRAEYLQAQKDEKLPSTSDTSTRQFGPV